MSEKNILCKISQKKPCEVWCMEGALQGLQVLIRVLRRGGFIEGA